MQSINLNAHKRLVKPTPEQLSQGEIALQLADHVIYTKDKNNNVVQISVSPENTLN